MKARRVLYISYDGMTDPLGSSQVIPYLTGLSRLGHKIVILSSEKPDRYRSAKDKIGKLLTERGIEWCPVTYHKFPPVLSTLFDTLNLYFHAKKLLWKHRFDTVHCRSYIPSLIGLSLKHRYGLAFVFDMRGFWADERVDGHLWNLKNPVYKFVYGFFKRKERAFLSDADAVVSLTYAGKEEMDRWPVHAKTVDVIPTCVDLETFRLERLERSSIERIAKRLSIRNDDKILVYLGSVGTWYLLEEMLEFFKALKAKDPKYRFLMVTPDNKDSIRAVAEKKGIPFDDLILTRSPHDEVPVHLALANLGVFFIRAAYSKKSSSPTKLGEMLAMGVPVIANAGVGDIDLIFQRYRVGHVMKSFSAMEFDIAALKAQEVERLTKKEIRGAAEDYFSLNLGVNRYQSIYERLPAYEMR